LFRALPNIDCAGTSKTPSGFLSARLVGTHVHERATAAYRLGIQFGLVLVHAGFGQRTNKTARHGAGTGTYECSDGRTRCQNRSNAWNGQARDARCDPDDAADSTSSEGARASRAGFGIAAGRRVVFCAENIVHKDIDILVHETRLTQLACSAVRLVDAVK
jgi:hypothetical protein